MKRPLAVSGFAVLIITFVLCIFSDVSLALLLSLISYALFTVSAVVPKLRKGYFIPTVMLSCLVASIMFYGMQTHYDKLSSLAGRDAHIVCNVKEEPTFNKEYGRYYCKAEVVTIAGKKYSGNIRLSFSGTYDNIDPD